MGVYLYRIEEDYVYKSRIRKRAFENEWFKLAKDGIVTVKGSNKKGYAWDGCSPKVKLKDVYIGTLEGVLNDKTGKSKTYYASVVHDVFYQFSKDVKTFIAREEVDREFYLILRRDQFRFARAYYHAVRCFGWLFWGK